MKETETIDARCVGFTLVELSIVLVIIGLVIGGVLVGKDLIRAAELRSIITDKERFVTAVYSFKTKYNALPGDFTDAQTIWGAAASCSAAQTTTATCNGDGDGKVEQLVPSGARGNEIFLFWKHLANATLISGNFWGIKDGTVERSATQNNAPSGKITNSLWYVEDWGIMSGSSWAFNGTYLNCFEFGLFKEDNDPWNPFLTTQETFALDSKIDDGKPGTGEVMPQGYGDSCTAKADGVTNSTASDSATAVYRTTTTDKVCSLIFRDLF